MVEAVSAQNAGTGQGPRDPGRSAAPTLDWEATLAELQDQIDALIWHVESLEERLGEHEDRAAEAEGQS